MHFLELNVWILLRISLKFVPEVWINNTPALVKIMAWCNQAPSHYLNQWWLNYWCKYASLCLNELIPCLLRTEDQQHGYRNILSPAPEDLIAYMTVMFNLDNEIITSILDLRTPDISCLFPVISQPTTAAAEYNCDADSVVMPHE